MPQGGEYDGAIMARYVNKPPDRSLDDPFRIKRWMCRKCGLVYDYQFEIDELGWPDIEVEYRIDEEGYHFEDTVRCARCNVSFDESPPVPIAVYHGIHEERVRTLHEQLSIYCKNLCWLQKQEAKLGSLHTDLKLHNEIEGHKGKIAEIVEALASFGITYEPPLFR